MERETQKTSPTSYRLDLLGLLSSCEENDVPLRGFDIAVLEYEQALDAVLLKCAELDKETNGTKKILLNYQVLLATHLPCISLPVHERHRLG